ncbi:MAG: hypothetical protein AAGA91_07365 [Pseudomonadota bacterium]
MMRRKAILVCAATGWLTVGPGWSAGASEPRTYHLHLEAGAIWQDRNKVQIPNDQDGDEFSLQDIAGSGPWPALRLEGDTQISGRHGIRLVYAPLSYSESGQLPEDTRFAGETYLADTRVKAEYKFNSWRVGYRYHLYERPQWDVWLGATLNIRDAKIELTQGATNSQDDDLGVVPLLYLAGEYRFAERFSVSADLDGLAGGPGRVLDLGIRLNYRMDDRWQVGVGYRTLEGGVDNDDVYNFTWFNSLLFVVDYTL